MEKLDLSRDKISYIMIFLTGVFGFSILGQDLLLNKLHFPFLLIEVMYIPLLIFYRVKIRRFVIDIIHRCRKTFVFLYYLAICSIFISVVNKGDVLTARSIIYLLFTADLFLRDYVKIDIKKIYALALGSIFGEIIYRFFLDTSETMSSMHCAMLAIVIFIPYLKQKYSVLIITVVITLLFSINTGYRIGILVVLISSILVIIWTLIEKKYLNKFSLKRMLFLVIAVAALLFFWKNYIQIIDWFAEVTNMSYFAKFRVTTRLQALLSGNTELSQDIGRFDIYSNIISKFIPCIIPNGLIESRGLYIDVPMIYLYNIFGSIVSVGLLSVIGYRIMRISKVAFTTNELVHSFILLLSAIYIILFVSNGTFLISPYQGITCGIWIGCLFKLYKTKDYDKLMKRK